MDYLNWELTVLSRAVGYSNLSSAAANIGLSQPQISRIVSKIENELGIVLLDREAKRKSSWTGIAFKLASVYGERERQLRQDIQNLVEANEPDHIRFAALEGLVSIGAQFSKLFVNGSNVSVVELNVHDLSVLESKFMNGDYDFILTSRMPGKKKYQNYRKLGYQTLDILGRDDGHDVFSTFEFNTKLSGTKKHKKPSKILVSNALSVRKLWIDNYKGRGRIPSPVKDKASEDGVPVWLIGQDTLSTNVWAAIEKLKVIHI